MTIEYDKGSGVPSAGGRIEWKVDGKLHRLDGPAVEWSDGSKEWWVNGLRHRLGGPAIDWIDGYQRWFIHGTEISQEVLEDPDLYAMWLLEHIDL